MTLRKVLALFITFSVLMSVFPGLTPAFGEILKSDSAAFDGFSIKYDKDVRRLSVEGHGVIPSVSDAAGCPWSMYRSEITSLVIGEGITGIASGAFAGLVALKTITFPSTIRTIASDAFDGCVNIQSISCSGSSSTLQQIIESSSVKELLAPARKLSGQASKPVSGGKKYNDEINAGEASRRDDDPGDQNGKPSHTPGLDKKKATSTPKGTPTPKPTPTPTPEETTEPTPTPTPEETTEPTATPTATPEETTEPTATPTATPEETPEPDYVKKDDQGRITSSRETLEDGTVKLVEATYGQEGEETYTEKIVDADGNIISGHSYKKNEAGETVFDETTTTMTDTAGVRSTQIHTVQTEAGTTTDTTVTKNAQGQPVHVETIVTTAGEGETRTVSSTEQRFDDNGTLTEAHETISTISGNDEILTFEKTTKVGEDGNTTISTYSVEGDSVTESTVIKNADDVIISSDEKMSTTDADGTTVVETKTNADGTTKRTVKQDADGTFISDEVEWSDSAGKSGTRKYNEQGKEISGTQKSEDKTESYDIVYDDGNETVYRHITHISDSGNTYEESTQITDQNNNTTVSGVIYSDPEKTVQVSSYDTTTKTEDGVTTTVHNYYEGDYHQVDTITKDENGTKEKKNFTDKDGYVREEISEYDPEGKYTGGSSKWSKDDVTSYTTLNEDGKESGGTYETATSKDVYTLEYNEDGSSTREGTLDKTKSGEGSETYQETVSADEKTVVRTGTSYDQEGEKTGSFEVNTQKEDDGGYTTLRVDTNLEGIKNGEGKTVDADGKVTEGVTTYSNADDTHSTKTIFVPDEDGVWQETGGGAKDVSEDGTVREETFTIVWNEDHTQWSGKESKEVTTTPAGTVTVDTFSVVNEGEGYTRKGTSITTDNEGVVVNDLYEETRDQEGHIVRTGDTQSSTGVTGKYTSTYYDGDDMYITSQTSTDSTGHTSSSKITRDKKTGDTTESASWEEVKDGVTIGSAVEKVNDRIVSETVKTATSTKEVRISYDEDTETRTSYETFNETNTAEKVTEVKSNSGDVLSRTIVKQNDDGTGYVKITQEYDVSKGEWKPEVVENCDESELAWNDSNALTTRGESAADAGETPGGELISADMDPSLLQEALDGELTEADMDPSLLPETLEGELTAADMDPSLLPETLDGELTGEDLDPSLLSEALSKEQVSENIDPSLLSETVDLAESEMLYGDGSEPVRVTNGDNAGSDHIETRSLADIAKTTLDAFAIVAEGEQAALENRLHQSPDADEQAESNGNTESPAGDDTDTDSGLPTDQKEARSDAENAQQSDPAAVAESEQDQSVTEDREMASAETGNAEQAEEKPTSSVEIQTETTLIPEDENEMRPTLSEDDSRNDESGEMAEQAGQQTETVSDLVDHQSDEASVLSDQNEQWQGKEMPENAPQQSYVQDEESRQDSDTGDTDGTRSDSEQHLQDANTGTDSQQSIVALREEASQQIIPDEQMNDFGQTETESGDSEREELPAESSMDQDSESSAHNQNSVEVIEPSEQVIQPSAESEKAPGEAYQSDLLNRFIEIEAQMEPADAPAASDESEGNAFETVTVPETETIDVSDTDNAEAKESTDQTVPDRVPTGEVQEINTERPAQNESWTEIPKSQEKTPDISGTTESWQTENPPEQGQQSATDMAEGPDASGIQSEHVRNDAVSVQDAFGMPDIAQPDRVQNDAVPAPDTHAQSDPEQNEALPTDETSGTPDMEAQPDHVQPDAVPASDDAFTFDPKGTDEQTEGTERQEQTEIVGTLDQDEPTETATENDSVAETDEENLLKKNGRMPGPDGKDLKDSDPSHDNHAEGARIPDGNHRIQSDPEKAGNTDIPVYKKPPQDILNGQGRENGPVLNPEEGQTDKSEQPVTEPLETEGQETEKPDMEAPEEMEPVSSVRQNRSFDIFAGLPHPHDVSKSQTVLTTRIETIGHYL